MNVLDGSYSLLKLKNYEEQKYFWKSNVPFLDLDFSSYHQSCPFSCAPCLNCDTSNPVTLYPNPVTIDSYHWQTRVGAG